MAAPLGINFSTDEKVVTQANVKLIGSTVESLIVEFDQQKFEQLLSSGSVSPKSMQKFRKVSNETRSPTSPKVSQEKTSSKANRTSSDKAHGSSSPEVHRTSLEGNTTCDQETRVTSKGQLNGIPFQGRDHSRHQVSVEARQTRVNHFSGWKSSTPSN